MKSTMRGELEETAAYVAGALFNIYSAPGLSGPYPFTPATGSIFHYQTAHNVAMQIAATPGVALNPQIARRCDSRFWATRPTRSSRRRRDTPTTG
jgi:hypothetical protein